MSPEKESLLFLSAVIVVTPGHLEFLENCLQDAMEQTYPFSEVIVIASGFNLLNKSTLANLSANLSKEKIRIKYVGAGPAGRNRNLGVAMVNPTSALTFFHDADDRYAAHRNEIVVSVYKKNNFDALAHFYLAAERTEAKLALTEVNSYTEELRNQIVIESNELLSATFPGKFRDRRREVLGLESPILRINSHLDEPAPIQHAHVVVSRQALSEVVFHEGYVPRNEDSLMLRDLLFSGKNVVVLCKPLSVWAKGTSSYTLQYKLRHLGLRIRQVLFMMGSRSAKK